MECSIVQLGKYKLTDSASRLQFNGTAVRVKQLKGNLTLKSGVNPADILDKQPQPPKGASALYERGQIVRELFCSIFKMVLSDKIMGQGPPLFCVYLIYMIV